MKHQGTKEIETERLLLRRFKIDDTEFVFNNWMSSEDVSHYLSCPFHKKIKSTKKVLKEWIEKYSENDFYLWAIVLKDINEPIGTIGLEDNYYDIGLVTVGYCIGKQWWHKGITSEALKAIIKFLFEEVNVNRIEGWHDPNNQNSGKVMIKCGMKFEGRLRQATKNNTGVCDYAVYSILAEDYYKNGQSLENTA
jgi:[ribosomal protein S5]-alanine N-acetyltransferase